MRLIEIADQIITEYGEHGLDLTLRQLYYQFVSRDIIPNKQKEYKRLGSIINDARLAGLLDWSAIVDRTRELRQNAHWAGPKQIIETCAKQFQIDKWAIQPNHVEVWIEKDALVGVIESICRKLDVPYFSCRGYTSQSEMWEASQRLERHSSRDEAHKTVIIHLGDHDPSGKDMTRDIQDRMDLFTPDSNIEVRRIALNMNQVEEHRPPPNPAKLTDSRCRAYMARYGDESWELDALDPRLLQKLISDTVLEYRDEELWAEATKKENRYLRRLAKIAKECKD